MKTIEITTTHNVIIRYELASIGDRIIASAIDLVLVVIFGSILTGVLGSLLGFTVAGTIVFVIIGTYHFLIESFNYGQSIGKKVLNLNVINLKGQNPDIYQSFLRWIFRLVDITMSLGIVGALFCLSSDRNQRVGDHFAHTTVIKNKKSGHTSLDQIMQINEREREIRYPRIGSFEESEIIFLKDVLKRYSAHPTDRNEELLSDTARLMSEKLNLPLPILDSEKLLSDLIIDYVYLNR